VTARVLVLASATATLQPGSGVCWRVGAGEVYAWRADKCLRRAGLPPCIPFLSAWRSFGKLAPATGWLPKPAALGRCARLRPGATQTSWDCKGEHPGPPGHLSPSFLNGSVSIQPPPTTRSPA
jgi:hypothetical protein